jgi:hypothetical protein
MDAATRTFLGALLADNERLEAQAALALGVARMMQELADLRGAGFGVPPLGPDLTLAGLREIAAALAAHLQPPNGSDGRRVLVGKQD